jgi:hypothetical protein
MKRHIRERILVRKILLALAVGVFFGTIFPALFVSKYCAGLRIYCRLLMDCSRLIVVFTVRR